MPGQSRLQCNEACLPIDAEIKATGKSPSKPPAEEGFAVYGLRNSYTRASDLMRDAMNGLYVYSIMVGGSLLALFIWISRRYDVPLYRQAEIAFLFGAFMLWTVIMTGLYSPFQSSVPLAQQNRNPAPAAAPSDNRVFLEKFFDTPQHSGQQPPLPALAYAAPKSDVLDNERKITSDPLLGLEFVDGRL